MVNGGSRKRIAELRYEMDLTVQELQNYLEESDEVTSAVIEEHFVNFTTWASELCPLLPPAEQEELIDYCAKFALACGIDEVRSIWEDDFPVRAAR